MPHEREETIKDIQSLLETPAFDELTPEELAAIIYTDVLRPALDQQRSEFERLHFAHGNSRKPH